MAGPGGALTTARRARRARRAFLVGVPAVLGAVLLAHPTDPAQGEVVASLAGEETRWLVVHVGLLFSLPLLGLWIGVVLDGVASAAASFARVAAVFFVAFYTAFDALVGVATGVLVREARAIGGDGGPAAELAEVWWSIPAPVWVFSALGPLSWLVTAGATALAHHRARTGAGLVVAIAVAAPLFAFGHPTIAGPVAMAALVVAAVLAPDPPPGATYPTPS